MVDADKLVRERITNLLQYKCECVPAEDGMQGLTYLEQYPGGIDLIISELELPQMSGLDMVETIQENPVNKIIPILMISSPEQMDSVKMAFDIGVDDILMKPLEPEILMKRVQNMLDIGESRNIHNVMEDLVRAEIEENVDSLGICPCPICRRDLMTLTLNNIAPKYVSTEKGAIISKVGGMTRDRRIKLLAEIAHYAQMIKDNPNHS